MENIVIEIPHNGISGGIDRMIRLGEKLIFELPHNRETSGGINDTIHLSEQLKTTGINVQLRFQKFEHDRKISLPYTVGLPDETFPPCNTVITYSDNPYINQLCELPQVGRVMAYMMSYGMSIERERAVVKHQKVTVLCTTKKLQKAIEAEGVKVHRIGFGLEKDDFVNKGLERKNLVAIMSHPAKEKRFELAMQVCRNLYDGGIIDGIIIFGSEVKSLGSIGNICTCYWNASREQMIEIFNQCKCYLFPSVSEGLSLTPIESTLCGCPSVICDGAIGEIYFNYKNCFISEKDNPQILFNKCVSIMDCTTYSDFFNITMREIISQFTWDKVIKNLKELL